MFTLLDLKKASLRACAMRYLEASIFLRSKKSGAAGAAGSAGAAGTAGEILKMTSYQPGIALTLRATTHARCGILKLLLSSAT